jgi:hypothetical protein
LASERRWYLVFYFIPSGHDKVFQALKKRGAHNIKHRKYERRLMKNKKFLAGMMFSFLALILVAPGFASPIVTYTVSGSSGNWTLDFSVTNTLGVNNLDIYFFGITNPDYPTTVSGPINWDIWPFLPVNPYNWGGPNINFNVAWGGMGGSLTVPDMIQNGETLSGFKSVYLTTDIPTNIQYIAYAYDWTAQTAVYTGTDYFNNFLYNRNPLFSGNATMAPVPEPISMLLFGTGIVGVGGYLRRKFKR